jgi:hypothetical protein
MSAVLVRRIRGGLWGVSSAVTERGLQGKAEWPSSVRGRPFGRVASRDDARSTERRPRTEARHRRQDHGSEGLTDRGP